MYENPVSKRTKQQNFLKTKTQSFLQNYKQSLDRVKSRSSMHNLAGTIYSTRQNKMMSPKKHMNRTSSASILSKLNPETITSSALKGLNMRASHIPNYSDVNTELILERRRLQERQNFLKEEIAKETRGRNKADMNCKKLHNEIEKGNNNIKQLNLRSERLNEGIAEARQDCQNLKWQLNELKANNTDKTNSINQEQNLINSLDNRCKMLKNQLLQEEKIRGLTKTQLIARQKVMNSASILMKELEHERAVLLLAINHSVYENKLE